AGPLARFIQTPALAGHAQPFARLRLAEPGLAAQGGERLAEAPGVAVALEPGHGKMMAPSTPGSEDESVSGCSPPLARRAYINVGAWLGRLPVHHEEHEEDTKNTREPASSCPL